VKEGGSGRGGDDDCWLCCCCAGGSGVMAPVPGFPGFSCWEGVGIIMVDGTS
jgi:hypothetical protein